MQSAGNFVGRRVELSTRVQLGQHDLYRRNFFAVDVHHVDGNSAAVVDYRDGIIDVNGDVNFVSVSGKRFVNGVVDNFVDEMVQSHLTGRADVHGGTFPYRFHAAEDFNGIGVVVAVAPVDSS